MNNVTSCWVLKLDIILVLFEKISHNFVLLLLTKLILKYYIIKVLDIEEQEFEVLDFRMFVLCFW